MFYTKWWLKRADLVVKGQRLFVGLPSSSSLVGFLSQAFKSPTTEGCSGSSYCQCSPQRRALQRCDGVWVWTNRSLPHLPPVLSFSLPLIFLCRRWCRYWTWVMMLSSLLASIYQCQTGSRSVACVCGEGAGGSGGREGWRWQMKKMGVANRGWGVRLSGVDGGKDELQQEGSGPARVRLWFIDTITARQN